jgi:hypothetical protein
MPGKAGYSPAAIRVAGPAMIVQSALQGPAIITYHRTDGVLVRRELETKRRDQMIPPLCFLYLTLTRLVHPRYAKGS